MGYALLDEADMLRKSNELIGGKYKVTLLENQIMSIALTRIETNAKGDRPKLEARLYPGELKNLIGSPSHIYRELKKVAKTMPGHTMFLEDGKGNFASFAIVTDADYMDGVFIIRFNDRLRPHILNLEKHYTTLELSVLTGFSRNSSLRIYELLKKESYRLKSSEVAKVTYNLSEFKFMIGLANPESQAVKNEMARMGNNIDWDRLYEMSSDADKKYENWTNLRMRVLDPAQKEMEEKSNIRFKYEGIRHGHKTGAIRFYIYKNELSDQVNSMIREKQEILERKKSDEIYLQLEVPKDMSDDTRALYRDYTDHNGLEKEDIDLLLKYADYDVSLVRKAFEQADAQDEIRNYMGWLIRCIQAGGYQEEAVVLGSAKRAKVLDNIKKDVNVYSANRRVWDMIKNKPDFDDFLEDLRNYGLSDEIFDGAFDYAQRSKVYTNWRNGRDLMDGVEG